MNLKAHIRDVALIFAYLNKPLVLLNFLSFLTPFIDRALKDYHFGKKSVLKN